jgi:N6-adenosine-specific RNA methylase IME4
MKFRVIVADPPWSFSDQLKMSDVKRGSQANYDVMTNSDIRELPMEQFISPTGSLIALWVPGSLLQDGMDTMKAWGFEQKQTYVWVKNKKLPVSTILPSLVENIEGAIKSIGYVKKNWKEHFSYCLRDFSLGSMLAFGMGRHFRQTHEICLIGTSDNQIYQHLKNKSQRSVCLAPNLGHSSKPEALQDSLELMFPRGKKLELFARRHRPGWVCLGNETCHGEDIRVSLTKLNARQP